LRYLNPLELKLAACTVSGASGPSAAIGVTGMFTLSTAGCAIGRVFGPCGTLLGCGVGMVLGGSLGLMHHLSQSHQ